MSISRAAHLDGREVPIGTGLRREGILRIDGEAETLDWHYDIYGGEAEDLPSFDGFVLTALFYAMRRGLPLRVHGGVTQATLYNLDEFISAWAAWRPKLYKRFEIIPDKIISVERPPLHRAIAAFSGGVDSTFTVLHNNMRPGFGGFDLGSAVIIHGFDIDYDNNAGFAQLVSRVQPTLDELGIGLKIIKSDSKKYTEGREWEDCYGAQIAGCLHQFSAVYDHGLIGSSEPYTSLIIPNGASPLTDRLFSGGFMSLVHHGAQFSRTMKVEILGQHPEIVERLKVCWEGKSQHENCGVCEKCIRTRLNFMAIGNDRPRCFVSPFDPALIKSIKTRKPVQLNELMTLIDYARERQVQAPWLDMLDRRLRWLRVRSDLIDRLERFGLLQPARKLREVWRRRRALTWPRNVLRRSDGDGLTKRPSSLKCICY